MKTDADTIAEILRADNIYAAAVLPDPNTLKTILDRTRAPVDNLSGALESAAEFGLAENARLLLDAGADPKYRDHSPLVKAAKNGNTNLCRLLVAAGSDAAVRNSEPLREAIREGMQKHCETAAYLIEVGADCRESDIKLEKRNYEYCTTPVMAQCLLHNIRPGAVHIKTAKAIAKHMQPLAPRDTALWLTKAIERHQAKQHP